MQSHNSPQERYISALRERNIPFRREDIESALSAESKTGRENAQWVTDHLGPETLLSREEATLLGRLEASGALQNFLRHADLPTTRPLLEEDIRTATATLKASTAAIQRQTAILKSQHELARRCRSRDNDSERDQYQELAGLNRRHRLEKQRVTAAADDLKNDIDARLSAQREQAQAEKRQLLMSVTAKLKDDDRALAKAETLASELESTEEDHILKKRAAELTSALSRFVSEEIYCRLDRLYLETLKAGDCVSGEAAATDDSIIVLEQDLESLYSEIEVLAEISARQQFGEQILRELQRNHDQLNSTLEGKLDLILHLVSEMTHSAEHNTEQLLYRQSCRETFEALSTAYKNELRCKQPAGQSSTKKVLRRESSLGTVGVPQPTGSIDRVKSTFIPQSQAFESFLRRTGISGVLDNGSSERNSLPRSISEKRFRMVELLQNLSTTADMPLAEYLTPTDRATELLYSALQADSGCQLSLVDVSQRQRLADLERQLGLVQKGIEGLNLDILGQRDKAQERFMERWR
ncbi:hypothetical protein VTN77DRAFT_2471 [Rasamsonia byssochlamydoides]|uniref:uncharacterized protein n=1 Tax=Rasamsonia byssochlamydoides TaxID=89139 RepID=UPI003742F727